MATTLKHSGTFTYQFLTGITLDDWWRMLRENHFAIDARYGHRAIYLTLMSVINSRYRQAEERDFGVAIEATTIAAPPVFILGHWRSGTTYLHNLLARDEARFAYPTVYQASFPHTFLSTETIIPPKVARYVPRTRHLDNMAFRLDLPQEDEFALCIATGFSSLLGMVFPQRADHYDRYLTLRGVPRTEVERWQSTLLWFLKKLTYKYNKTIVLKSPPHTARIRLLLGLFPNARFVHICRDPYAVFRSTRHMYDTMVWHTYLQRPDTARIDDGILRRYVNMYDAYFEERALIPPEQLYELRFEDLRCDLIGQIGQLYNLVGWGSIAGFEPQLRAYVDSLGHYRQNDYIELDETERGRVAQAWQRNFEAWGYAV